MSWLSIAAGRSGQGSGTVEFTAAANNDPVVRNGGILVNGSRAQVTQAAGQCRYTLGDSSAVFAQTGGPGRVDVRPSSALCTWTANSDTDWIVITSGASGTGNGSVGFTVAPTTSASRTGTLTIAGQVFTVTQSPGCVFDVSPLSHAVDAGGGTGRSTVTTGAGCGWTATSNVPWITIAAGGPNTGSGSVTFTVAPTSGSNRTGTLTVAGQTVTVVQSQGCTFAVAPATQNVPSAGGSGTVSVTAGAGCPWSAASNASWITIGSGGTGSGNGTVTFTAAATTGPSRSGTISIAGQTVTVVQGQGCTFGISPDSRSVPASGGDGTVSVTAGGGCAWTAASNAPWITITSGASGSGNGSVGFRVAATSGPARTGTLTIAGRTFTVNQGADCTTTLSSSSATAPTGGGNGAFDVRTAAGCGWAASSNAPWLTVTAGATGEGNGTVRYTAAANSGPERTGTITAAGQTFTVRQDGGCSFAISPTSHNAGSDAGNTSVAVTAANGCAWNAASNATWISISSGTAGSGNGTVQLGIASNPDAERRGTVTIAGQTFTVVQAGGCTFSLTSPGQSMPAAGGTGSFDVMTTGRCAWTATSNASWISITSGASETGRGTVQFTAAGNIGGARTGTITAAGQTFTVTQESGCSAVVAPETITAPAAGGSQDVSVTTAAECAWTAVSNAAWIAIGAGASGSGNGTVRLDLQANPGPARSGTATIAGRTVSVNQDTGCTYSITPTTQAVPVGGGGGSVTVRAAGGCAWTAVSNVPWVAVTTGGSGSGDGTVQFTVEANATNAQRTATITIGGQVFTIEQAGS